jgi:acyl dehydratase
MVSTDATGVGWTTLLRAALPSLPVVNLLPGIRKSGEADLPSLVQHRPPLVLDRAHVASYAAVCGFPEKDTVPVTYPHLLGFGLQLRAMADPSYPFAAVGGVHLANSIAADRPLAVGEVVGVRVWPENLQPHAKWHTVDFVTEVSSRGDVVWLGRSTYLSRGHADPAVESPARQGASLESVPAGVTWRLSSDVGRRYAHVSGDRNPIHLYPVTARALGFRRQIAHGMWSAARCVAAVENRLPDAVGVDVAFRKPVFLPGTVGFGVRATGQGLAFALTDPRSGAAHVLGRTIARG